MFSQYSTRTMMGLVAVLSASLALTRVHFLFGAGVMVAYVVAVAVFGRNSFRKRALVYGSVGGACMFVVVTFMVETLRGESPRTSRRRAPESATALVARQYAIPIGGFLGGLTGCIYSSARITRTDSVGDSCQRP